jgi:hypothetical protein
MTRTGKIARLPKAIRDELNQRLENGELGVYLVEWLNTLPEVQQVLTERFDGRPINEVNLTEWKGGGYLDWLAQQDTRACAQNLAEEATGLKAATDGAMAEHLGTVLAARYAQLLTGWNGEVDEAFRTKLRGLQLLCHNITLMRREDMRSVRLELEKHKRSQDEKTTQAKALELCVAECKKFPEVDATFKKAFAMLDEAEGIGTGSQGAEAGPTTGNPGN